MTNFKVSGVGIDTSTIFYYPSEDRCNKDNYDYIYTSISKGNSYIISNYIKSQPGATLISEIDYLNNFDSVIPDFLYEINRDKINLLLFNSNIENWEKYKNEVLENIAFLKEDCGLIEEIGLKNPKSVDEIKKINEILGFEVKYIALDICPFNFNYDIINWCYENKIHIIGFNPFGGYISSNNLINSFTIPYLLSFSSNYSDVVILSGRDLLYSSENFNYIKQLIGKESSPKYTLKKNVLGKLVKPFKKIINTSLIVSNNLILSYEEPEKLFYESDIDLSIGKYKIELSKEKTAFEEEINTYISTLSIPEDSNDSGKITFLRYKLIPSLCKSSSDKGQFRSIKYLRVGDNNLIMTISFVVDSKKRWFKKNLLEESSKIYILTIQDNKPYFFEVENSRSEDIENID